MNRICLVFDLRCRALCLRYKVPEDRGIGRLKIIVRIVAVAALLIGILAGYTTLRAPLVARYQVAVQDWPPGAGPLRIVQLSDIHAAGPDMPPSRVARIVAQANALQPDAIVITGDFVSDRLLKTASYDDSQTVAPLRGLRARLGIFAVLGNHDHWRTADHLAAELEKVGVVVLTNRAARAGPVLIAGLDDSLAGAPDPEGLARMLGAMPSLPTLLITHNPDIFPLLPRSLALVLAGHTHGGQIRLPLIGPLATASAYGRRYLHGLIEENGKRMVVSAGLGVSIIPVRFGVPPEIVLVTLHSKAAD